MEAKLKMVISAAFTFAIIGFVLYLLIIMSGFLGSCLGINHGLYEQILVVMALAALATFGVCFYTSCYRKWRKSLETNKHNGI